MAIDAAVVGAGIVGLSTALHLAERGAGRIIVYERAGIGAGASGVQPGGVRQQWSTRLNCAMARDSLAFYSQLRERLQPQGRPRFRPCGYLFVAHEPATLERLRRDVALQNDAGVPSQLLSGEEAAGLVPDLRVDGVLGASFCGEDGFFDRPQGVVEAFADAAQRLGVLVERLDVTSLEPVGDGFRLSFADGTSAEAGRVVIAAAVATAALARPLGIELPIAAEDRWLFLSDPIQGAAARAARRRARPRVRRQAARRRPRAGERPRREGGAAELAGPLAPPCARDRPRPPAAARVRLAAAPPCTACTT